ncbi:MAG: DsbE family thiol:disulfide interchange protein [Rhodoferax sp.]|nr:DsbE family thiol:disulfide interchange protein [Rhodoferax sp.]
MSRWRFVWPLVVLLVLVLFLGIGLRLDPREVPSPLIGRPAPDFALSRLDAPERSLRRDDLRGQVWLLNVWASWCAACRVEHPVLMDLSRQSGVLLYGLNYKDEREAGLAFLRRYGDPYQASLHDPQGRLGLDFGVYGVPETFVIDRAGVVRYKHIGPLTPDVLRDRILPLVRQLHG